MTPRLDPLHSTPAAAEQRRRALAHLPWVDERGRAWTAARLTGELLLAVAVVGTAVALWVVGP